MKEIVVLSGKGGTGKTSLSAAFATIGREKVVADCDVDAANLHLILQPAIETEHIFVSGQKAYIEPESCTNCGLCMDYCRFDAIHLINNQMTISETSCDGCRLCEHICPENSIYMILSDKSRWFSSSYRNGKLIHAKLAPGEENSGKLVLIVRETAKEMAKKMNNEEIILDGPPGIGCPAISSITGAHTSLIVTEATRSGLHDLKRILVLTSLYKTKTHVVINKFDLNHRISDEIQAYCTEINIPVIGKIPFDPEVVTAMIHCKSIVEWNPKSKTSRIIRSIHKQLFDE